LPTWADARRWWRADAERAALSVAVAAALVLSADAFALHRAAGDQRCAPTSLPPATQLEVSLQIQAPALRNGDRATGRAVVVNRSRDSVLLTGAEAVLVTPGTRRPLSWTERLPFDAAELRPGTYAQVPFVLHLARCRSGASALFPSGFYEVVLLLEVHDATGRHVRSSSGRAVVVSP
jgi:hypothetical protein